MQDEDNKREIENINKYMPLLFEWCRKTELPLDTVINLLVNTSAHLFLLIEDESPLTYMKFLTKIGTKVLEESNYEEDPEKDEG